jgi:DNA polymerase-3 subunit epsilon
VREIILDTETTGLRAKSGDRLVEIAGLELVNHISTGEHYHQYINPQRLMPDEAFAIHGLSDEFLSDKPIFSDIAGAFLDCRGEDRLVIHNASFDIGFINNELDGISTELCAEINYDRVVDTLALARRKHPFGPNSLDALCRRYNIDNSTRTFHGALLDCELLAEVYLELSGGRQPGLHFENDQSKKVEVANKTPAEVRPEPLPERLKKQGIAEHTAFVETLGDNAMWREFGIGGSLKSDN